MDLNQRIVAAKDVVHIHTRCRLLMALDLVTVVVSEVRKYSMGSKLIFELF